MTAPRAGRHAARQRHAGGRHARTHGRGPRPLYPTRSGPARHAARPAVRQPRSRTALNRYDRFLIWSAGWLLHLRIVLLGENPVSWDR
ncbi:hypothetical protein ACWDSJ_03400 [Nocardia sp. NPDC003482]